MTDQAWPADKVERRDVSSLVAYARNSRTHSDEQVGQIAASIKEWGWTVPVLIDPEGGLIAGHGRILAAQKLGITDVPCMVADGWTDAQKQAYVITDNKLALNAGWDDELLKVELKGLDDLNFDLTLTGFDVDELADLFDEPPEAEAEGDGPSGAGSLAERFGVPPFSVLNAREGWWQDRKRAWVSLGISSELGRDAGCLASGHGFGGSKEKESGATKGDSTSVFDPTLCELAYTWFSPQGGIVLDPFAGGSVRGIVASKLGRQYIGHELRPEQVEANRAQAIEICDDPQPVWHIGDSRGIDKSCADVEADMIFSCPPYADLEVYSDDPKDLSTLGYEEFRAAYFEIIAKSCALLKDNRFACFVVGEVRDKKGNYYNFVGDTVEAFKAAGLNYYNEAILVTMVGTKSLTTSRNFPIGRKFGKTHQNVLVFVKGDGKKATKDCGLVEVYIPDEE